jgi:hypothetical protein
MEQLTTTCDRCGVIKSDVNHWFITSLGFPNGQLVLEDDSQTDTNKAARHICGPACLSKEVACWATKTAANGKTGSAFEETEFIPWPFTLSGILTE